VIRRAAFLSGKSLGLARIPPDEMQFLATIVAMPV
jgi:hypothetical protein